MPKKHHKTKYITIDKHRIPIDIKLYNLIKELNKVGIRTEYCCQGDKEEKAYISIDNSDNDIQLEIDSNTIILRWFISRFGKINDE